MEEKNDHLEEGQAEVPKMETPLLQDFQGPPPGETGTAPLREEATPPITMESLPKGAEPVVDVEESSLVVAVVTAALIRPQLGPVVAVEVEWVAGLAETSAHLLLVAITMSPKVRGAVAGMVRIGPSITQPGPGTGVKPAVRVRSMRKSQREGGREVQRLAARVVQVTLVPQTRMRTRNPTTRMARITPTLLAAVLCHMHHPEAPRPGSSPPGVSLLEEEGVVVVEEVISTGVVVVMLEEHLEVTELDLAQYLMLVPPSHQPLPGSSKVHHKALVPKTWAGEVMEEIRKRR